jgi:ketosteroid isomerase-like protein
MLLTISFAVAPAVAQHTTTGSSQDARQVAETLANEWVTNYNAGNAAGIGGLFTIDGTYVAPAGTKLSGPQAIATSIAGRIKTGWTKESVTISEAHAMGNAIWAVGDSSIVGSARNSGKQIGGRFAEVLTQDGGAWRIRMLIAHLFPSQDVSGQGTQTRPSGATGNPR